MLNENMKVIRKSKGLSQQDLAVKLNVVRQTISKWEQGLSVPDADMLISISEALGTPVSTLLGETIMEAEVDSLKALSEKLEVIVIVFFALSAANSPYLNWNYGDPEIAVVGVALHAFEWLFVRLAPIVLIGAIIGILFTRKKA